MEPDELLEEIRLHAEFVAKGAGKARRNGHANVRRLLENLEQVSNEADWNRSLVAERISAVRDRVATLAAIQGSQNWELDQHWAWTTAAIDSLQDAMRSTAAS